MSSYTTTLHNLSFFIPRTQIESWFKDYNLSDFLLPEQLSIVENSPFWSKDKLATQIVDHYLMREIGAETPALFKLYAKTLMKEIMEEKLPIIYTLNLKYDPLVNVDFTETFKREAEGNGETKGSSQSNANNNSSGINVHSNTPQGQINKNDILNGSYASDVNASETSSSISDNTNNLSNSSQKNKEQYTRHLKGNQGISATYQAMIKQFRDNIIAVNKEIINELNPLFIGLF